MATQSPATRVAENARPVVMALGAMSAALAGANILLCLAIAAMTVMLTIRLYSLTH